MENSLKKFLSNSFIYLLGTLVTRAVSFFFISYCAHILTQQQFGQIDYTIVLKDLSLYLLSFCTYEALLSFKDDEGKPRANIFKTVFFTCFPLILLTLCLQSILWKSNLTLHLALLFAFAEALGNSVKNYHKINNQNRQFLLFLGVQSIATIGIALLQLKNLDTSRYIMSHFFGSLLAALLFLPWKNLKTEKFDGILAKEILKFSIPISISNMVLWLLSSSDRIILERLEYVALLGVYAAIYKLPSIFEILSRAAQPALTILAGNRDDDNATAKALNLIQVTIFFGVSCLILIIKPLFTFAFGTTYAKYYGYVPIVLVGTACNCLSIFLTSIYHAKKLSMVDMLFTLLMGLLNVGAAYEIAVFYPDNILYLLIIKTTVVYVLLSGIKYFYCLLKLKMDFAGSMFLLCLAGLGIHCYFEIPFMPILLAGILYMTLKKLTNNIWKKRGE